MKKQFKEIIFILSLLMCFLFPSFCSASFDEYVDPRWEWYYSDDTRKMYLDTQSIEYNAITQIANVWTMYQHQKYPSSKFQYEISFKDKRMNILRSVMAYPEGMVSQSYDFKTGWSIRPDSDDEALANSVASILHISPIYKGGSDRWKWVHSTDTYGLYIAKDTIVYIPDIPVYGIWTKKLYLDGHRNDEFYTMIFEANFINADNGSSMPEEPVPDSDEEYIFNATKELLGL